MTVWTRRQLLRGGVGLLGGMAALGGLSMSARAALAQPAAAGSRLRDIEHVVVFMQENRSFDHYFGSLSGVCGFDDPLAQRDPRTGRSVFEQYDPFVFDGSGGTVLPWHLGVRASSAQNLSDVDHSWQAQHASVAAGANDRYVASHALDMGTAASSSHPDGVRNGGARVMSYFTREDLPFHYGLADAFTICDRYFCSVIGPTNPNRLYLMSATIDPEGTHGGPDVANLRTGFSWTTYPERLQNAGIDWYVYRERDDFEDNMLDHFVAFQDEGTELFRRGRSTIPDGQLPQRLRADVESGNLPQVSWIVGPEWSTEHAAQLPAAGAFYLEQILEALTADPAVWRKTLLILTYDENGGFFDHVPPPLPPPGTAGEYLSAAALANTPEATGIAGPIGLGPRVPTLLISPFTRGGYVCSDTFDHTSVLRFLETRFGVEVPNLSAWRRETCGDLTSALNLSGAPNLILPQLPDTVALWEEARAQSSLPAPQLPPEQFMPRQEPGSRPRPSGLT
ncbi:alkaline phosphatase family protein [Nocardia sp. NPDC051030]|uniref:alkaline phosphatase family protein n=1 Tax=Nocardia sp. NPDC051030 TaxID=3155162 RepID=UPI0034441640